MLICLYRIKIYLEPLAIATNIAQGPSTHLDHVLIMLATLHETYGSKSAFDDPMANAAILLSLEKRWDALKQDQDCYIVAIFLNPYICAYFFNDETTHSLTCIGLFGVMKQVYQRVFRVETEADVPKALFDNYLEYYDGTGLLRFSHLSYLINRCLSISYLISSAYHRNHDYNGPHQQLYYGQLRLATNARPSHVFPCIPHDNHGQGLYS
ncbi:hypothetical protein F5146DRAFT_939166 [Armillaria mellea]|nr:hypothetical protein F5146DRAFT_939166 [Armillaria mellea]